MPSGVPTPMKPESITRAPSGIISTASCMLMAWCMMVVLLFRSQSSGLVKTFPRAWALR